MTPFGSKTRLRFSQDARYVPPGSSAKRGSTVARNKPFLAVLAACGSVHHVNPRDWTDSDSWELLRSRPGWQNALLFIAAPLVFFLVAALILLAAAWIF